MRRCALIISLLAGLVPVAGCGSSDNPKVSDASGFVSKCENAAKNPKTTNKQLADFIKAHGSEICKCTQQKLNAAGLGDKTYTDPALKNRPETVQCAEQVLRGSGG